jgi:glycerol-3-phosphate dehydrogenase
MEARILEPTLSEDITGALYAPSTGTVNPWQLGIAAYENALQNGCNVLLNTKVTGITKDADGYIIQTDREDIPCRCIINCAGMNAVQVQQMVHPTDISLQLDGSDYLVMDKYAPSPAHIIFQESEDGKGITAIPCVEGNLLLESTARPLEEFFATSVRSLESIQAAVHQVLPSVDTSQVIRSFGAVRPNPHRSAGESIHDFCIEQPADDFISFIGVKTPGLTCANELGYYAAEMIASYIASTPNRQFDPTRKAIGAQDHDIICQCEQITKSEILQAIARGATSVEAIKRRVGSGMGRCQGSRCTWKIQQILEECQNGAL